VEAGEVLISQGEEGDRYFAIAAGEVDVTRDGVSVKVLRRGDGVGEVALLTDVPRTATVTAVQPTVVWEVDREPFLLAVTGHESSRDAAWRHMRTFDD
jgi:CRP-like cAMP-binding protein